MTDAIVRILDYAIRIKRSDIPARVTYITAFVLDTVGLMVASVKARGFHHVLHQLVKCGDCKESALPTFCPVRIS